MTKLELQAKIEALQSALDTKMQESKAYQGQLNTLQEQLKDINKPKLTSLQFDELYEAIERGIESFDFDDCDNYDTDFHIDYDNRIAIESMQFQNADELLRIVYDEAREIFAEIKKDDNQLNQD